MWSLTWLEDLGGNYSVSSSIGLGWRYQVLICKLDNANKAFITAVDVIIVQIDGEKVETVSDFIFLGSKINTDGDGSHEIKNACSSEEKLWYI